MKLIAPSIFLTSLALAVHVQPARAPEVIYKRDGKLAVFLGAYDRIVKEEPVRVQRCVTPGTVWWNNACFRPERIPRS